MNNESKILIIIPAYNEEGKIGRVVEKIRNTKIKCKILVIDDCSIDSTRQEAQSFGALVIRHKKNSGVGAAIRTGIKYGLRNQFDFGAVISGDDQHEPKELPQILEPVLSGRCLFVQGSRYMDGGQVINEKPFRKATTIVYSILFSAFVNCKVTDATNGLRSFSFKIFDQSSININQRWLNGYELEPYLLYNICVNDKFNYLEVPITLKYHDQGQDYTKMKPLSDWWRITRPMFFLWSGFRK